MGHIFVTHQMQMSYYIVSSKKNDRMDFTFDCSEMFVIKTSAISDFIGLDNDAVVGG